MQNPSGGGCDGSDERRLARKRAPLIHEAIYRQPQEKNEPHPAHPSVETAPLLVQERQHQKEDEHRAEGGDADRLALESEEVRRQELQRLEGEQEVPLRLDMGRSRLE